MYSDAEVEAVKRTALRLELQEAPRRGKGKASIFYCPNPSCKHPRVINPTDAGLWYCQRCQAKGDVFVAVQLREGISRQEAFVYVMNRYGSGQALNMPRPTEAEAAAEMPSTNSGSAARITRDADAWRAECRRYLMAAAENLPGSPGEEYMRGRGFTAETLRRFRVGFDARAKIHGVLPYGRAAVVYPYSRQLDYYAARFLKPMTSADGSVVKAMMPDKDIAGEEPLFNAAALYSCEAVVICEGPFDCMAIAQGAAQIGANVGAVALCGTACDKLIRQLSARPTAARLLIALDNDEAGRTGAVRAAEKLDAIGQRFELLDSNALYGGANDAGEVLQTFGTDGAVAIIDTMNDARL